MSAPVELWDVLQGDRLWHKGCDGRVVRETEYLSCVECSAWWPVMTLLEATQLDRLFYIADAPEPPPDVLVEDESDGKRFLRLVPASEAHKYQKARIGV